MFETFRQMRFLSIRLYKLECGSIINYSLITHDNVIVQSTKNKYCRNAVVVMKGENTFVTTKPRDV